MDRAVREERKGEIDKEVGRQILNMRSNPLHNMLRVSALGVN